METISTGSARLDYLDSVRAFALILGVVFHASLSFMPIFIGWSVMDVSTSDWVPTFVVVSHSFRMPLFFLIAGFFSHMTFHRKGGQAFLNSRLIRIAIPFVVGWFLLRPLLVSGWVMGAESMRGDVNLSNALNAGLESLREIPSGLFVGTHLWFLYYLLLVSICVVTIRSLVCMHQPIRLQLLAVADSIVARLGSKAFGLLILALPMAICLWFMTHWGIDTPDKSLVPDLPVLFLYCSFFLFGWLLHRQAKLLDNLAQISAFKIICCAVSITAVLFLSQYESQSMHQYFSELKAVYVFSYAVMAWSLIMLVIGLGQKIFSRPNKSVRYIADASYWLYLIHLPIVIGLQIAFAELPFHWLLKLIAICVITLSVSILLYQLFVRSTWLGAVLNGTRKRRFLSNSIKSQP